MKIGIITTHYGVNYGAVLQAFSLESYLTELGHDVEILDFRPNTTKYGRKYLVWNSNLKQIAQNIVKIIKINERKKFESKIRKFDKFINDNLTISSRSFSCKDEFTPDKEYDLLICGSDQIWNMNLFDIPEFFLPFNDLLPNSKYISYAASVAESLSETQWEEISRRTSHFSGIAFREKEASDSFRKLGRTCETVLDPVFLHTREEWDRHISESRFINEKYVLCYFIGYRGFEGELAQRIADLKGCKILNVGADPTNHLKAQIQKSDISPFEFIRAIRDAEFIITNSFHMTSFSVIYRKNFFVVSHTSRNSRMSNLLNTFEIRNRFINDESDIHKITTDTLNFDYGECDTLIEDRINYSKNYLRKWAN